MMNSEREKDLRIEALNQARQYHSSHGPAALPDGVVETAEKFFQFLKGTDS
jgi:hypothetical protein